MLNRYVFSFRLKLERVSADLTDTEPTMHKLFQRPPSSWTWVSWILPWSMQPMTQQVSLRVYHQNHCALTAVTTEHRKKTIEKVGF